MATDTWINFVITTDCPSVGYAPADDDDVDAAAAPSTVEVVVVVVEKEYMRTLKSRPNKRRMPEVGEVVT